nr:Jas TPL-binding domain containing protein [Ipomoea batatas]
MFSGEDEIFDPPGGSWNIYPKFVAKEINLTPQSSGIGPNYNGVPIYEKGEEYCSCALTLGRGSNGKGKEPINVSSMVGSSNNVVVPPSFFSLQLPSGDGGWGFTDDNFDDINNVPRKNKRKRQYTYRKMSVYSFPTNVKNLLSTGIFEVNAYEFEKHAGFDTKHPNNNIYFPSGKSLYYVVQELKVIPQNDLLFEAIQTASGTPINIKNFKAWKALYESVSSSLGPNPMNY